MTEVAICVATMHRPQGLSRLLASLARLHVPPDVLVRVVVVDNDAKESARATVAAVTDFPFALQYVIEPKRGIPFARNTGVGSAGDCDWIAFVDDDETVAPCWLAELIRVARTYEADVVTGTVLPEFTEPPPHWAVDGAFYQRPRFKTGTPLTYARTSNALVAQRLLSGDAPFSEAMRNNGGDDTHFFQRVHMAGGAIVWADDAIVTETVPASRVRPWWLIRRSFRRGNTLSLCLRDLEDSWHRRIKRVLASVAHFVAGTAQILSGVFRGRVAVIRGVQRVAFAAGLVTGLVGHSFQEYAVTHGS